MQGYLKKWGNSPAVRIPASIMEAAKLSVDQAVEIRVENGRVVIEPVTDEPAEIDMDAVLSKLDPAEKPDLVSFGEPRGSEVW